MNTKAQAAFQEDKQRRYRLWVRVDNAVLFSPAFLKLNGHAVKVLLWAKMKIPLESKLDARQRKKLGKPKPEPPPFSFTHAEAECFGLTRKQFAAALRQLVELGFFDVRHKGSGKHKDFSLFNWSDRWTKYDTPSFESVPFPKNRRHLPRSPDGRWASAKGSQPPMADIRNRAEKYPCENPENVPFKGNKVPSKDDPKGRNVPLVKGRNVPLKNPYNRFDADCWEPLIVDDLEWAGEGIS
jgi:hypothetical protein